MARCCLVKASRHTATRQQKLEGFAYYFFPLSPFLFRSFFPSLLLRRKVREFRRKDTQRIGQPVLHVLSEGQVFELSGTRRSQSAKKSKRNREAWSLGLSRRRWQRTPGHMSTVLQSDSAGTVRLQAWGLRCILRPPCKVGPRTTIADTSTPPHRRPCIGKAGATRPSPVGSEWTTHAQLFCCTLCCGISFAPPPPLARGFGLNAQPGQVTHAEARCFFSSVDASSTFP